MNVNTKARSPALDTSHLDVGFPFRARYVNFINGAFVEPIFGRYFENVTPLTGEFLCEIARSNEDDVNLALDAAHATFPTWGRTSTPS